MTGRGCKEAPDAQGGRRRFCQLPASFKHAICDPSIDVKKTLTHRKSSAIITLLWRCNSVGQSSRFIPDLSSVRIGSPLPKNQPPSWGLIFCRVAPLILTGAQRPFGNAPAPWRGSARSRRNLLEDRREAPAIKFLRIGSPPPSWGLFFLSRLGQRERARSVRSYTRLCRVAGDSSAV